VPWPAWPTPKPAAPLRAVTLIGVVGWTARDGRSHPIIHLPEGWHREQEWASLFHAAAGAA
jgi:hypothetical protein